MLEKICIEGYKSINKLDLDLKQINIFIGSNGAGKSNFISFFKLINNIVKARLQNFSVRYGVESFFHFGRKHTQSITTSLVFDDTNRYDLSLGATTYNTLFIKKEICWFNSEKGSEYQLKGTWYSKEICGNKLESELTQSTERTAIYVRRFLNSYNIYHFHDTSELAPLRSVAEINDNIYLRENGGNLAAFLYLMKINHEHHFHQIEYIIKSVVPCFEKFQLLPNRLNHGLIHLEWIDVNYPDIPFNAIHLSDGSLRFIALVTLLMQPVLPAIIIIDEPEIGLHPYAINILAALIKKAAAKSQIIIATQSIDLVNNFQPENIITVDREKGESVFNRLNNKDLELWLSDYTLGTLWQKQIIKGQPN